MAVMMIGVVNRPEIAAIAVPVIAVAKNIIIIDARATIGVKLSRT